MGATETVDLFIELINDDRREKAAELFAEHAVMGISVPGSDERTNLRGRDKVGVMTEQEALSLVALRGALFETVPEGAMLGVRCSEERLRPLLGDELDLAAINGPELCLTSGPVAAIDQFAERLAAQELRGGDGAAIGQVCGQLGLGGPQRGGLRPPAALGDRLGDSAEQHGEPQPYHQLDLEASRKGFAPEDQQDS